MSETLIEWCDSAVNPVMGCDGCELWSKTNKTCYAGVKTGRHKLLRAGKIKAATKRDEAYDPWNGRDGWPHDFDTPMEFPTRMRDAAGWKDLRARKRRGKPWLDGLPRCIFVSDMGDALSKSITFDYLHNEIIAAVNSSDGQRHIWMWLTKQPARMVKFSEWLKAKGITWPENLWAMTSVTTQRSARARIPALLAVGDESTTRGLSVEPLWEEVSLAEWMNGLDWVIVGGESGDDPVVMDLAWARRIRDECRAFQVPFFLKQLGGSIRNKGGDWSKFPEDLRVRQVPRRSRKKQIDDAGKSYRKVWERVPISRELTGQLDALASKKGQKRRDFLDAFLRKHLPESGRGD